MSTPVTTTSLHATRVSRLTTAPRLRQAAHVLAEVSLQAETHRPPLDRCARNASPHA